MFDGLPIKADDALAWLRTAWMGVSFSGDMGKRSFSVAPMMTVASSVWEQRVQLALGNVQLVPSECWCVVFAERVDFS